MESNDKSTKTNQMDLISFGYGGIVLAGGLIGYLKAKSIPSLASGVMFGSLASYGGISDDIKNIYVGLGTSLTLLAVMGNKFRKTGKFMPPGLIASLSLLQSGRLGYNISQKN